MTCLTHQVRGCRMQVTRQLLSSYWASPLNLIPAEFPMIRMPFDVNNIAQSNSTTLGCLYVHLEGAGTSCNFESLGKRKVPFKSVYFICRTSIGRTFCKKPQMGSASSDMNSAIHHSQIFTHKNKTVSKSTSLSLYQDRVESLNTV